MDVERRNRNVPAAHPPALTAKDPLALVDVSGVVEPAREDVVVFEARTARVLVPARPGHRAFGAREVDRGRLAVLGLVGTAALGIWLFGEPATVMRLACIGLIVSGIVGLKLVT